MGLPARLRLATAEGIAGLLVLAIAVATAARAADSPSFDYLYVHAHEGNASGGHAAIRFGDSVFDFQHEDGLVAPRREDARRFQHLYRTLENRSIERSRVAASAETVASLRDAFERRLLAQSRQLELGRALDLDVALLAAVARGDAALLPVRGAGFFAPSAAGDAALRALRERIDARYGRDWLVRREADASRALRDMDLDPPDVGALAVEPLAYPVVDEPLSRRVAEALAARRAVEVLSAPHALRPESLTRDVGIALDAAALARLGAARAALLDAATALAASRRPDWGEAFLLAAARIVALDRSLAAGRLVVLDALPPSAARLPATVRRRALVPALLAEASDDLSRAREDFFSGSGFREASWSALESAASRVATLLDVAGGADALRVAPGALLPEGVAPIAWSPRPNAGGGAVERALAATRAADASVRERLAARYGYDLIRRNCVTAIFETIDLALGSETAQRLGGRVDPAAGANFVPFVSSRSVRAQWNVVDRAHLASVHENAIARDGSLAASLRESSPFTADFYEPGDRAGFFLFFTDASWPLRPLLGALNLSSALVRSGLGLATLPIDRGAGLRSGLDGALWSVPELFFANIRKGTNDWVAPELRPPVE